MGGTTQLLGNQLACDWCQEELALDKQVIKMSYHFHLECLAEVNANEKLNAIFFGKVEPHSHIKQTEPTTFVSFWADEATGAMVGMDGGLDHHWIVLVPEPWEVVIAQ